MLVGRVVITHKDWGNLDCGMALSMVAAPESFAPARRGDENDDTILDELLGKLLDADLSVMDLSVDSDVFKGLDDVMQAPLEAPAVSDVTVPGRGVPRVPGRPQAPQVCERVNASR